MCVIMQRLCLVDSYLVFSFNLRLTLIMNRDFINCTQFLLIKQTKDVKKIITIYNNMKSKILTKYRLASFN